MSNTPKRQHIVPQFILRNFVNNDGKLNCFDKGSGKVYKATPPNAFVVKYMYTHQSEDGTTSTYVESELSHLEGRASAIVRKLIESGRAGSNLELTSSERDTWWRFLYSQFNRSRFMRDSLREVAYNPDTLPNIERELGRPLSAEEREEFDDPAIRIRMTDDVWLGTMTAADKDPNWSRPEVRNRGIGVAVIKNPSESFVIGDMPLLKSPSFRADIRSPEARLLYPISWDIMVEWGLPDGNVVVEVRTLSDPRCIRALNEMVVRESNVVAGRSEELIRLLSHSSARET